METDTWKQIHGNRYMDTDTDIYRYRYRCVDTDTDLDTETETETDIEQIVCISGVKEGLVKA